MLSFLRLKSCILVGFTVFYLVVQSENSTSRCLGSDADIQEKLTSISPPFDNYFNISRAIYPSTYISSLYVKIRVKFVSDRENETQFYTWAMSCLYVSTQHVSLLAMNLYSLGAIFPNRRQRELEITLPELCSNMRDHDNGSNSKMIYFLSTLEDIAIKPGIMEPQMNTVECVVRGHTAFTSDIFSGNTVSYHIMMNVCWCAYVVSCVLAIVGALVFDAWIKLPNRENKHEKKSAKILLSIVFIVEVTLAFIACCPYNAYSIVFIVTLFILSICFLCYMRRRNGIVNFCQSFWVFLTFSTLFMTFHHFIWIIFGVLTEPFWAVPVLVVACSFCFSVFIHAYYYYKAFPVHNPQAAVLSIAVILCLLLFFFVTGVVSQSFLSSDPVFGLIQSALVVVYTVSISYVQRFA